MEQDAAWIDRHPHLGGLAIWAAGLAVVAFVELVFA
jgi:hypothetical protein